MEISFKTSHFNFSYKKTVYMDVHKSYNTFLFN